MCTEAQREVLLDKIQRHLAHLKRLTYGKHIVSRVEKLLINAAAYAKEVRAAAPDFAHLPALARTVSAATGLLQLLRAMLISPHLRVWPCSAEYPICAASRPHE